MKDLQIMRLITRHALQLICINASITYFMNNMCVIAYLNWYTGPIS